MILPENSMKLPKNLRRNFCFFGFCNVVRNPKGHGVGITREAGGRTQAGGEGEARNP